MGTNEGQPFTAHFVFVGGGSSSRFSVTGSAMGTVESWFTGFDAGTGPASGGEVDMVFRFGENRASDRAEIFIFLWEITIDRE